MSSFFYRIHTLTNVLVVVNFLLVLICLDLKSNRLETIAFTHSSYDKIDTDKYLFSHKIRIHLIITYLLTFLLNISSPFFSNAKLYAQRFCEPSVKQFVMFLTKADMFVCKQILRFLLLIDYIEFIHKKKQQKLVILQN